MARILLTNDDGIDSEGLQALRESLVPLGEIVVVAPDREMSAVSQSITLRTPLSYAILSQTEYSVDGTPADCVILALRTIMKNPPDLIVSGINKGANLGDDISYSGTVAAALEGTLNGIPSFAVSLASRSDFSFKNAADFSAKLAEMVLSHGLPEDVLMNVNVPVNWTGKLEFTRQGKKRIKNIFLENKAPHGRKHFWLHDAAPPDQEDSGSDFAAIEAGSVSITPLHLNRTDYKALESLSAWQLELDEKIKAERKEWLKNLSSLKI